jgi:hypothetical protein
MSFPAAAAFTSSVKDPTVKAAEKIRRLAVNSPHDTHRL